MNETISMVRFLMFMILSLIIFFNLAPLAFTADDNSDEDSDEDSDNGGQGDDNSVASGSKYCLVDGETHKDKVCEEVSPNDSCQNRFASLEECKEWKDALEYDTVTGEDGSLNYLYTTDDIDKQTIMTSDDMIYCLKNDKECEKMKFGDCHDIHIGTYMSEDNCKEAKQTFSGSAYSGKKYCFNEDDDECIVMTEENSDMCHTDENGDKIEYCNMNECKSNNTGATGVIEGEYCFNGSSCDQMDCDDTSCDGKYYTSLSTCKSNNGLS